MSRSIEEAAQDLGAELVPMVCDGVNWHMVDNNDNAVIMGSAGAGPAINALMEATHFANSHWWVDNASEDAQLLIVPTKLMLIVSELAEAMEGHRKDLQDDKLPHRSMLEVELADVLIRLFDLAGRLKLDLGGAYVEKMRYNRDRADHKPEARAAVGGKQY